MKKLIVLILCTLVFATFGYGQSEDVIKIKTSAICKMCKKRIERDMSLTKGVNQAELNLDNKVLTVAYNAKKTNPEEIRKAVTKIGYDADTLPADEKAHSRLPECCQKTGEGMHDF